ncbi:MAG TPA: DUF1559 domain-containing protein [Gemmataceae bacterium]|nr:DUF1559 domain-containing protein [Gemmataceae bacterium]
MRRLISAGIVVVLLGIVGGLAICAIPRIRDAAARSQCRNNLKQVGLALQNRYASCGTFPSATIPNEDLPCGKRLSWLVEILPYLEQIGCTIDRKKGWQDEANIIPKFYGIEDPLPPRPLELKLFRCPADPTVSPVDRASLTNYVGISGVGADAAELPLEYPGVGFFGCERKIKREDIKDGLANTLAVMETNSNIGPWTAGGFATVRPLDPATIPYLGAGRPFGSGHRDGTQALFADGSVHSLTHSTDSEVLGAFATIAGGEQTEPLGD